MFVNKQRQQSLGNITAQAKNCFVFEYVCACVCVCVCACLPHFRQGELPRPKLVDLYKDVTTFLVQQRHLSPLKHQAKDLISDKITAFFFLLLLL